ncbi:pyrroline-5-carboxylate reductase [Bacillus massilinigeriensis]|uniref:pyrroline-5-carboxylate reductase n=1 Tax=Bacillus massilionigeriensis TaxID=1805475 RepID=UPI00096AEF48|nr:pyrroline-5-carboxylate reductase [Bacillus massilionigeriensis]
MNKITIIGAGSIAEAIISGMVKNDFIAGEKIWTTNRSNQSRLQELQKQYGVSYSYKMSELVSGANMIVLAMKPKDAQEAIEQLNPFLKSDMLLVSVLAGISIDSINMLTEKSLPIVRAMPNTSATVGKSATALAFNEMVTTKQMNLVKSMFDTVGLTTFVKEDQLDAVTGLSGSGPAYIYYLVEALEKSAIEIGLEEEMAKELIVQTLLGAAEMLSTTTKKPQQLRKEVTSPGGTTEAGINILEAHGVQKAFIHCIKEATAQSKRLGSAITLEINKIQKTS